MLKKIIFLSSVFALAILLVAASATAKEEKKYQAEDIKIYKKIKLTPEQKAFFEQKGQPDLKGKPPKPSVALEAATGVLGQTVQGGKKYAILVGICDYPGTGSDICLSDGDALNMQTALTTKYGFLPENIKLFRDDDAIRDNIALEVAELEKKVTSKDEVVFFFSGHGTTAKVDDGDSEKIDEGIVVYGANNTFDYIWDGELRDWFSGFNTSRIVFVFDSCMAGGMNDVAGSGRVVVMSSKENQSSYVYSGGENGEGVFSRWFVNLGMINNQADGVNQLDKQDGYVTVEESFQYAKDIISRLQIPVLSDNFVNDLLF